MKTPNTVLTIDGGFATQLTEHVGNRVDGDPLWSARYNATNPAAVVKTHLDFLRAGAQVILTNTYQASVAGYGEHLGLSADDSVALMRSTVGLAREARAKFLAEIAAEKATDPSEPAPSKLPLIVASIGPFGAHLNDGSEYTGDYADRETSETIKRFHRDRLGAVIAAGVDALAIETVPCRLEAEAMVALLTEEYPQVPFWMSFQCKADGVHLAHGEEVFADVARAVWQRVETVNPGQLLAVGVNCLNPQLVSGMLTALNANRGTADTALIPSVVYPNSGELYTVAEGWTGRAACTGLYEYVDEWIALGARFIGGCCRTYAKDIQLIRSRVQEIEGKLQ